MFVVDGNGGNDRRASSVVIFNEVVQVTISLIKETEVRLRRHVQNKCFKVRPGTEIPSLNMSIFLLAKTDSFFFYCF